MQKIRLKKSLSFFLCLMLIATMALCTTGCSGNKQSNNVETTQQTQETTNNTTEESNVLGTGKTTFTFSVVDADSNEKVYEIHTDKTTVGDALLELELIDGDPGDYGLYVKTVDGITVDYSKDGKYWAFYIDGEYAQTGVDSTDITEGASYSFKVE